MKAARLNNFLGHEKLLPFYRQLEPTGSRRRLLTVGHSYVVRSNRLLAEAIQSAADGRWEVTVAAPAYYRGNPRYGDIRPETLRVDTAETVDVVGVPAVLTNRVHFALYGTQLRKLLASGFDAVHCWEEPYMLSASQVAAWTPRRAVLTYQTFQNMSKSYPPPFNWLERRVLRRADGWIAGATLVEKTLKDRSVYKERPSRTIGLGIDPTIYSPRLAARNMLRSSFGWNDKALPVIGYLGRFTEAKGVPLMCRVLDRLRSPWRALFVGNGEMEYDLRSWSDKHGARVKVETEISHDEVPDFLSAMDIICVPSQTTAKWHEQFGRVLIEAFACGVCVVASNSGEIPYVVGEAGIIVSECDEQAWLEALDRILSNESLRRKFIDLGHDRVEAFYTWSAIGRKYVEFLDELCDNKARYADRIDRGLDNLAS